MAGKIGRAVYRDRRWAVVQRAILIRDKWRCASCSLPGRLEIHHKQPISEGGAPFDLANLQALCTKCHHAQHDTPTDPERAKWAARLAAL